MEENVDLGGAGAPSPKQPHADKAGHINQMNADAPDISSLLTPGQTTEQLVDAILNANPEQLIKWEDCYLPSQGLYYDNWVDGLVQCKPMGQLTDKILATQRLAQTGQAMDHLFRECCRLPAGFDPVDLLLGDRTFLLFFLRGITHGNLYEFAFTCPNTDCADVSTHQYDLNDLAETIVVAKPELGSEPFKVVLPYMSKMIGREFWVGVRFLRGADANAILAQRKVRNKMIAKPGGGVRNRLRANQRQAADNQQLDDSINQNMEKIIVNIMGVSDLFKVRRFIQQMHGQDTATIREWLRENTPGIDNTVTVRCPSCDTDYTVELPISESFFRPSKPGGTGT